MRCSIFILLVFFGLTVNGQSVIEITGGGLVGHMGSKTWNEFRESYNSTFTNSTNSELGKFGFTGGYEFGMFINASFFLGGMDFGSMYSSAKVELNNSTTRHFKRKIHFLNAVMGLGGSVENGGAHVIAGLAFLNDNITSFMEYPDGDRNIASNQLLNGVFHGSALRPFFGFRAAGGAEIFGAYFALYWMPAFPNESTYLEDWDAVKRDALNSVNHITALPRQYGSSNATPDQYVTSDISYFIVKIGLSLRIPL